MKEEEEEVKSFFFMNLIRRFDKKMSLESPQAIRLSCSCIDAAVVLSTSLRVGHHYSNHHNHHHHRRPHSLFHSSSAGSRKSTILTDQAQI